MAAQPGSRIGAYEILIDGQSRGVKPLSLGELALGAHAIDLLSLPAQAQRSS